MNYMLFSSIDANFKFIINENNLFHTCYIYFYSLKCAFTYTINFKIIIIFYNYENIEDNSQLKSLYDITRNVRLWLYDEYTQQFLITQLECYML